MNFNNLADGGTVKRSGAHWVNDVLTKATLIGLDSVDEIKAIAEGNVTKTETAREVVAAMLHEMRQ